GGFESRLPLPCEPALRAGSRIVGSPNGAPAADRPHAPAVSATVESAGARWYTFGTIRGESPRHGDVAKWQGKGLQNPHRGFDSHRRLQAARARGPVPFPAPACRNGRRSRLKNGGPR